MSSPPRLSVMAAGERAVSEHAEAIERLKPFDGYGRARFNDEPTSADQFTDILKGLKTLDLDAGPSRTKIYAYGSGGVHVKELTPELKEARYRLKNAGYITTVGYSGREGPLFLRVEHKP